MDKRAMPGDRSSPEDYVAWSMVAMWGLAAAYLLATFTPY